MTKRKLLIGLLLAGLVAGGFSAAVIPASARTVTVTFASGRKVTVDVPPGTPVSSVVPSTPADPIVSIIEDAAPSVPTNAAPSTPSANAPSAPAATTPSAQPTPPPKAPASAGRPSLAPGGHGRAQRTTGHRKRKAQPQLNRGTGVTRQHRATIPANAPTAPPKPSNPTYSLSIPGPTQPGVPNFFIDKFRVPIFLLPIYQAAGNEYGVPWQVLAAINEIETDYGRDLSVSSAGAMGWMQFLPSTWAQYGVDATGSGKKDPYNPADAIFAAARYLKAAGAQKDLRQAIFAYNHATWYVDSVMLRAQLIGGLPDVLLGSLTGLTQGHFPVAAPARYADDPAAQAKKLAQTRNHSASATADGVHVYARAGSPVIAVQDGKIVSIGSSPALGKFIRLRDAYGNTYTYAHLKSIVSSYPVPKPVNQNPNPVGTTNELRSPQTQATTEARTPGASDTQPTQPATAGQQPAPSAAPAGNVTAAQGPTPGAPTATPRTAPAPPSPGPAGPAGALPASRTPAVPPAPAPAPAAPAPAPAAPAPAPEPAAPVVSVKKERLFANPHRPGAFMAGGRTQIATQPAPATDGSALSSDLSNYFTQALALRPSDMILKPLTKGSTVIAGTILGRIGSTAPGVSPHVLFEIRPAGAHSPLIDAKPILDGWKLLEASSIYRAAGQNPFLGTNAKTPSVGQIFLMSKEALAQRVLRDPNLSIYQCGRRDVAAGLIDRRPLAMLEYLSLSGIKPTVTGLRCGQGTDKTPASIAERSTGNGVEISKVNDIPVTGHQGAGSVSDLLIKRLLTLQGFYKPQDIISTMSYPGTDNTIALPDHKDSIHVGYQPLYTSDPRLARQVNARLKPSQWIKLIDRLRQIPNPVVPTRPTNAAIPAGPVGG